MHEVSSIRVGNLSKFLGSKGLIDDQTRTRRNRNWLRSPKMGYNHSVDPWDCAIFEGRVLRSQGIERANMLHAPSTDTPSDAVPPIPIFSSWVPITCKKTQYKMHIRLPNVLSPKCGC